MKYDNNNQPIPETVEEYEDIYGYSPLENKGKFISITETHRNELYLEPYAQMVRDSIWENDNGVKRLNDGQFAKGFALYNNLVHANGAFYTPDGFKNISAIKQDIQETLYEVLPIDIAANTNKITSAIKNFSYKDAFDFNNSNLIPFSNGDMYVHEGEEWEFKLNEKQPVPYRLPIGFTPINYEVKTPNFNKWLNDLFTKEDITTLQEYLGYCLLPTTRCQKALLIIGEKGAGKSVISKILTTMFGASMTAPDDMTAFFADKFKTAELENQLVFYEDDLGDALLKDAGKFKKLVTSQFPITADRKGEQPFKFTPYCRFIMCGNHMLETAEDKSGAFERRLLPLSIKNVGDRTAIPYFEERVVSEIKGIVQWAILGLKRLIENEWQFTVSDRTKEFTHGYQETTNHFITFMNDCVVPEEGRDITNHEMRTAYDKWCRLNSIKPLAQSTFNKWLFNNGSQYGITKTSSNNIKRDEKRTRGYYGAYLSDEYLTQKHYLVGGEQNR